VGLGESCVGSDNEASVRPPRSRSRGNECKGQNQKDKFLWNIISEGNCGISGEGGGGGG